jgi:RNA exonuclease 4
MTKQTKRKREPQPSPPPAAPVFSSNWNALKQRLEKSQKRSSDHLPGTAAGGRLGGAAVLDGQPPAAAPPTTAAAASALIAAASSAAAPDAVRAGAIATIRGPFPADAVLTGSHTSYVALDCEMVGVGPGGVRSALSQVVVVDWLGRVLLCKYVKPSEPVTDYRTHVSGCTPALLRGASPLGPVQAEVAKLLASKTLVGHGLKNDLQALLLSHPAASTRDTAQHRPFQWRAGDGTWRPKKLKHLVFQHLSLDIQREGAAHDPAEDARGALALYKLHRREWEHSLLAAKAGKAAGSKGGGKKKASAGAKAGAAAAAAAPAPSTLL